MSVCVYDERSEEQSKVVCERVQVRHSESQKDELEKRVLVK